MAIVVLVHVVYHRHIMNIVHVALKDQVVVDVVQAAVVAAEVMEVVDLHTLDDRQVVHGVLRIMGMEKVEGNNIIHRKVCSTSQSDLEICEFIVFAGFVFIFKF